MAISSSKRDREAHLARTCVKIFKRFKKAYATGNIDDTIKHLSEFTSLVEKILPTKDFYELFGGEQNIFVRTQILGFRDGDEKEDSGLISSSLGRLGSEKSSGPLQDIQSKMGITESEFLIYWLINKI
jgi:hypothetical protein